MRAWEGRKKKKNSRFRKKKKKRKRNRKSSRLPTCNLALGRAMPRRRRRRRRSIRTNTTANRRTREQCSPCATDRCSSRRCDRSLALLRRTTAKRCEPKKKSRKKRRRRRRERRPSGSNTTSRWNCEVRSILDAETHHGGESPRVGGAAKRAEAQGPAHVGGNSGRHRRFGGRGGDPGVEGARVPTDHAVAGEGRAAQTGRNPRGERGIGGSGEGAAREDDGRRVGGGK